MSYQKYTNEEITKLLKITSERIENYKEERYIYESIYAIYKKDKSHYNIKAQYMYYTNICDKLKDEYEREICVKIINILNSIMDKINVLSNGKHQYINVIFGRKISDIIEKTNELIPLYNYYYNYKMEFS
tara:strand:+ start:208 stop:597 length:390 start_codon:yes stop_codon:yes gene_type:complete